MENVFLLRLNRLSRTNRTNRDNERGDIYIIPMKTFAVLINFCIALFMSVMTMHAEQNLCAECMTVTMDETYIYRAGYGKGKTQQEADSLALFAARGELLKVLRDSVKATCHSVKVVREAETEYLSIQFFNKKEEPMFYYFALDSVLVETPICCQQHSVDKKGRYISCYLLKAKRKDFSNASMSVFFRALNAMANLYRMYMLEKKQ